MLPEAFQSDEVLAKIEANFSDVVTDVRDVLGQRVVYLRPEGIFEVAKAFKEQYGFNRLSSVTAVDWWPKKPRFEVVYHLHSVQSGRRLRFKVAVDEHQSIDSVTPVWKTANWYEREVFDLFGIAFENHPNLERIMMPADWEGHPLRKDYPVHGHKYTYAEEG